MTTTTSGASELRQRKNGNGASEKSTTAAGTGGSAASPAADDGPGIGFFDVVRLLAGLALVSTIGSYAVTQGESLSWGLWAKKPWWMDYRAVRAHFQGPLLLTNEQLSAYDGSDPSKPILLALNRTIYDVSASPNIYGVGGMYSALAAKDASRSYVTQCFDPNDDLVPYFGGVEEVFVPLWLSRKPHGLEVRKQFGEKEIVGKRDPEDMLADIVRKLGRKKYKEVQDSAYESAKEMVRDKVKTWEGMFAKKNYPVVGRVVGVDEEDPNKWRHLKICEKGLEQRPPMAATLGEAFKQSGKKQTMNIDLKHWRKKKKKKGKINKKKLKQKILELRKKGREDAEFRIEMGIDDEDDIDEEEAERMADLAHTQIKDMLKGGKHHHDDSETSKKVQEMLKDGPENADPETLKTALRMLKERKNQRAAARAKDGADANLDIDQLWKDSTGEGAEEGEEEQAEQETTPWDYSGGGEAEADGEADGDEEEAPEVVQVDEEL